MKTTAAKTWRVLTWKFYKNNRFLSGKTIKSDFIASDDYNADMKDAKRLLSKFPDRSFIYLSKSLFSVDGIKFNLNMKPSQIQTICKRF